MNRLELAKQIAMAYLGRPYIWGGDDPIRGFDCSGFVIEILKSVGALPRQGDWTAQGLYNLMVSEERQLPNEGFLVFWTRKEFPKTSIYHVELCLNADYSIGASGGGSRTTTEAEAILQNAYIKVRPIESRKGPRLYVNPFKFNHYE